MLRMLTSSALVGAFAGRGAELWHEGSVPEGRVAAHAQVVPCVCVLFLQAVGGVVGADISHLARTGEALCVSAPGCLCPVAKSQNKIALLQRIPELVNCLRAATRTPPRPNLRFRYPPKRVRS